MAIDEALDVLTDREERAATEAAEVERQRLAALEEQERVDAERQRERADIALRMADRVKALCRGLDQALNIQPDGPEHEYRAEVLERLPERLPGYDVTRGPLFLSGPTAELAPLPRPPSARPSVPPRGARRRLALHSGRKGRRFRPRRAARPGRRRRAAPAAPRAGPHQARLAATLARGSPDRTRPRPPRLGGRAQRVGARSARVRLRGAHGLDRGPYREPNSRPDNTSFRFSQAGFPTTHRSGHRCSFRQHI